MMVGAVPQTVSATRIAIRILRENICSDWRLKNHFGGMERAANDVARKVPRREMRTVVMTTVSLGIYPAVGYFPAIQTNVTHSRNRWLSGRTTFCVKA